MLYAIVISIIVSTCYGVYLWIFRPRSKSLVGEHVLITGGSSGIGKSVALEAAARGAHVTIVSRNVKHLEKTISELMRKCKDCQKQKIQYLSLDVTRDYETIRKELLTVEENVAPVDILVNCAGMAVCGRLEDMSAEDVKYMMDLNYFGTVYPTKALLGGMKSRGKGIIVLVSSGAGLTGVFGMGAYGASKWAVRGLGEALMMEVIGTGVTVTVSYPPDTDTPGFEIEERTKPVETSLISAASGLAKPHEVSRKILDDALNGSTYSVVGLESWMLANLCVMSYSGILYSAIQASYIGILRLVFAFYQRSFVGIVLKCRKEKETNKKAE